MYFVLINFKKENYMWLGGLRGGGCCVDCTVFVRSVYPWSKVLTIGTFRENYLHTISFLGD